MSIAYRLHRKKTNDEKSTRVQIHTHTHPDGFAWALNFLSPVWNSFNCFIFILFFCVLEEFVKSCLSNTCHATPFHSIAIAVHVIARRHWMKRSVSVSCYIHRWFYVRIYYWRFEHIIWMLWLPLLLATANVVVHTHTYIHTTFIQCGIKFYEYQRRVIRSTSIQRCIGPKSMHTCIRCAIVTGVRSFNEMLNQLNIWTNVRHARISFVKTIFIISAVFTHDISEVSDK